MLLSKEEISRLSDKELRKRVTYLSKNLIKTDDDVDYINSIPVYIPEFLEDYDEICNEKMMKKFKKRRFSINGWLNEKQWEYLCGVLFDDIKDGRTGSDLTRFEIKSAAVYRSKAEFKSARINGLEHIESYHTVDTVVILYDNDYKDVTVLLIRGTILKPLFDCWAEMFRRDHAKNGHNSDWCFRRALYKELIHRVGHPILIMKDRELVFPRISHAISA